MRRFFNKHIILMLIIFILQSLNVVWCITNPIISNSATYFAIVADGFIFGILFTMLINSK